MLTIVGILVVTGTAGSGSGAILYAVLCTMMRPRGARLIAGEELRVQSSARVWATSGTLMALPG